MCILRPEFVGRVRSVKADGLRSYFDLQLRFAEAIVERKEVALSHAVFLYTNLYRRFGLGPPGHLPSSSLWQRYVAHLDTFCHHSDRLAWTWACYLRAPAEKTPADQQMFGCFSFELGNKGRLIRLHFMNRDYDGLSPLHPSKTTKRRAELQEAFTHIKTYSPEAREVRGASWLYNTQAYRSLFPMSYGESRTPRTSVSQFQGSSSWGQFLDYRGNVKTALADTFRESLENLDVDRLWKVFPLATFMTVSPIEDFYEFFGVH